MTKFRLEADFREHEDQRKAITALVDGLEEDERHQVLLGVTGSGKTFTMARVIEEIQRPALVIAHNKTLAAQLFQEFRSFFSNNAVEYFVSYYDYYQPEAYIPQTDTYIEKDASINDEIDKMRHSATRSVYERRDVLIVASVSCIYGLGSPHAYYEHVVRLSLGEQIDRDELLRNLTNLQYERHDIDFQRGRFRVRGDVVDLLPSYSDIGIRIEFFGDQIDALASLDPLTGAVLEEITEIHIYPNTHYISSRSSLNRVIADIQAELHARSDELTRHGRQLEATRLYQRTMFDIEMIQAIGFCHGIENYARHLDGRQAGDPPFTLLDYMPKETVIFIDESHVTVPQLRGMYVGDRSRKLKLVEYGFRLPSALDNRPLRFDEFEERGSQRIYVSATPGPEELAKTKGRRVEQIIRPTGLMDPPIEIRSIATQVDDLMEEIRKCVGRNERVLVTTLTKKMAEELTGYFHDYGIHAQYLHADVDTLERVHILQQLRAGQFDVLIGVNLLREGLDLPEVSLVAILDADKEGFLRSATTLIQTAGRAARNVNGRVLLYADRITDAMQQTIQETERRRQIQAEYNERHDIQPRTIVKPIADVLGTAYAADYMDLSRIAEEVEEYENRGELEAAIHRLERNMREAADRLDFERAAQYRDQLRELRRRELMVV